MHQVVSTLLYSASSSQFTDVWVGGRRLMQEGGLSTLDEQALIECAAAWQRRMADPSRSTEANSKQVRKIR